MRGGSSFNPVSVRLQSLCPSPQHVESFTSRTRTVVPHEKTQRPRPRRRASCCRAALLDLVPGRVAPGSQGTSPSGCTPADPESSGGAPSPAGASSRHPGTGELSSSPWAVVIRRTSWSRHQAGKWGRKEKGRKTEGWERRRGAPTELEKLDLIWQ